MDRKLGGLVLFLFSACAQAQSVTEEYDRFTGQRILSFSPAASRGPAFGVPTVRFMAKVGGTTPINAILFASSPPLGRYASQQMQYIGCRNIDWVIDGVPAHFGVVVHNFKRYESVVMEFVNQAVTAADFARIGAAKVVEYRLCGITEGTLSIAHLDAAQEIATKLGAAPPPEHPGRDPAPIAQPPAEMKYRPKF